MLKKSKPYIISIALALSVGGLSALLTSDNMNIYEFIEKPLFSPPSILFPIVWTVLYILMGISSALVLVNANKNREYAGKGLFTYGLSLVINFFWSIIFFNLNAYLFAFVWLILLFVLIVITISDYSKVFKAATYLQIPYLIWVVFAGYLNLMIYILN